LARLYNKILDELVGYEKFDWRTSSKELY